MFRLALTNLETFRSARPRAVLRAAIAASSFLVTAAAQCADVWSSNGGVAGADNTVMATAMWERVGSSSSVPDHSEPTPAPSPSSTTASTPLTYLAAARRSA